jgi:membrane-associated protease RseP (regulator of RpoE activity)
VKRRTAAGLAVLLVCLTGIVAAHEVGHALAIGWMGGKVESLNVGFGPAVARWSAGDVEYAIRVIPLGGYTSADTAVTLPPGKHLVTALAGPGASLLFGVVVLGLYAVLRRWTPKRYAGYVGDLFQVMWGVLLDLIRPHRRMTENEGFGTVAQGIGQNLDGWRSSGLKLIRVMGGLSISLGCINLLPFPPFDGGIMALDAIEWATGRPVPASVQLGLSVACLTLVILPSLLGIVFDDARRLWKAARR